MTQSTHAPWKSYDHGSLRTPLHRCPRFTSRHVHTTFLGVGGTSHRLWLYRPCRRILWAWIGMVWMAWPDCVIRTSVTRSTWPGCVAIASSMINNCVMGKTTPRPHTSTTIILGLVPRTVLIPFYLNMCYKVCSEVDFTTDLLLSVWPMAIGPPTLVYTVFWNLSTGRTNLVDPMALLSSIVWIYLLDYCPCRTYTVNPMPCDQSCQYSTIMYQVPCMMSYETTYLLLLSVQPTQL